MLRVSLRYSYEDAKFSVLKDFMSEFSSEEEKTTIQSRLPSTTHVKQTSKTPPVIIEYLITRYSNAKMTKQIVPEKVFLRAWLSQRKVGRCWHLAETPVMDTSLNTSRDSLLYNVKSFTFALLTWSRCSGFLINAMNFSSEILINLISLLRSHHAT